MNELKDPRAIEWMKLTRWIRGLIVDMKITTQQFIEAVCNDKKHWWVRRSLEATDEIAPRKIVRGEELYIKLYEQFFAIRAKNQAGEIFIARPIKPTDVLQDIDIQQLEQYFPLYAINLSYDKGYESSKIDITEYQVGINNNIIAIVYLQLIENCADKMDRFILELSKIYVKTLNDWGFNGILQIKNSRNSWWL